MMLIVLDKDAHSAANLIPDRLKFKQLIELCQLICSAGISDVFKPVRQGKEIMSWILKHKSWVYSYMVCLVNWTKKNIKVTIATAYKIDKIQYDLFKVATDFKIPKTAIFRYKKEYECNFKSNIELPIDIAIEEYKKYMEWKGANRCKKNKQ